MRVCMILSIQEWNTVILDVADLVSGSCDGAVDRKKKHFRQSSWKDTNEDPEWLMLSRKRRQVVSDPDMATCKHPITLRDWAALVSGDLLASISKLVLNICDYGSPMWQRVYLSTNTPNVFFSTFPPNLDIKGTLIFCCTIKLYVPIQQKCNIYGWEYNFFSLCVCVCAHTHKGFASQEYSRVSFTVALHSCNYIIVIFNHKYLHSYKNAPSFKITWNSSRSVLWLMASVHMTFQTPLGSPTMRKLFTYLNALLK